VLGLKTRYLATRWLVSLNKHERQSSRITRRVEAWDAGLASPLSRAHAWLDLLLVDHGLLRLFYRNRHAVTPRFWRSAQPTPADLKYIKAKGVKTVICVRSGQAIGAWPLEKEACEKLGLELHKVKIRGRVAPRRSDLLDLVDLLASLSYPALVHCKSGADRSGFVSAIYLIAIEGRSIDEGLAQLSLRFGHLRYSRAGILCEVIEAFRRDAAASGIGFRQWVETSYDAAAVSSRFRPRRLSSAIADFLLRREG
jgi:protein tyrosine/serine phosphatase